MSQSVLIGLLFIGAAFYLGRMVFRSFQAKNECATGCGKCAASSSSQELTETLK
ncbi:MAG: FeoB-associated Cys-rich membrane protein [Flammeovirgaceae bacterium]